MHIVYLSVLRILGLLGSVVWLMNYVLYTQPLLLYNDIYTYRYINTYVDVHWYLCVSGNLFMNCGKYGAMDCLGH